VLNATEVKFLNKGLICSLLHRFVCSCAAYPKDDEAERKLVDLFHKYTEYTQELVDSGDYDGRDDFAVVLQPFMKAMRLPRLDNGKVDFSYFAPDCFHLSNKGQAAASLGLWNNMLELVGQKRTTWTTDEEILCPTADRPYLSTKKNSIK
jgi:phospholipase B1, membrane-associated